MPPVLIEVAVDTQADALAAIAAGADRLELCADLTMGGRTPDVELLRCAAAAVPGRFVVMVRESGEHFRAEGATLAAMERAIGVARDSGAAGMVFGCLTSDDRLDLAANARLVRACGAIPAVLHRAFDRCADWRTALDQAIDMGFRRVLTSGGECLRADGAVERLARLADRARGRIELLPGGGLRHDNAVEAVRAARGVAVHTSGRDTTGRFNADEVRAIRRVLAG